VEQAVRHDGVEALPGALDPGQARADEPDAVGQARGGTAARPGASIASAPSIPVTVTCGSARQKRIGMSAGPQPRSASAPPVKSGKSARKRSTKAWFTVTKSAAA